MFTDATVLHAPPLMSFGRDGARVLVDPDGPNWVATDARGAAILGWVDGHRSVREIASRYAQEFAVEPARAWIHVRTALEDGLRTHLLSDTPFARSPYAGRAAHLEPRLRELWIQVNNFCNLTCSHCLVTSGPQGDRGMDARSLAALVDQAIGLGVRRMFVTGGEPFLRDDLYDLIARITATVPLTILTNGTRCDARRLANLPRPDRLRLQVSCDGASPATNDPVRGEGTFARIVKGVEELIAAGVTGLTLACVVTGRNVDELPEFPRLAKKLGVESVHFMWLHRRGRATERDFWVSPDRLVRQMRAVRKAAAECGVRVDNDDAFRLRLDRAAGDKLDLGNAGVESLCVNFDGRVYPSASFSGVPQLECGSIREKRLDEILRESPVCREFRRASVREKALCRECPLKFLCGGGDIEHSYWAGTADGRPTILGADPYCELWKASVADAFEGMAQEGLSRVNRKAGFDAPHVVRAMGDGERHCASEHRPRPGEVTVSTLHSNCVLSADLDLARERVRTYYGKAAESPEKDLCCPTSYPKDHVAHIPRDVIDRFYGCGSPISQTELREGEAHLDLGSGAGIDCFIASKFVGKSGRSIGVDMTDAMLKVAQECAPAVAKNLGWANVEFRKGFLEDLPVEDRSVDCVTSNCVINLSPDKSRVFAEMWRVLRDHGRIVVSDIVSGTEVPVHLRGNERLWGECLSGALTEDAFLAGLEKAGFYGVQVLKKTYWKNVERYAFYSVTVRGWKFEKKAGCVYVGQTATYQGPGKAFVDEEGHVFPRGVAIEVCTDTAAKLSRAPYEKSFVVTDPTRERPANFEGCGPGCC
jgi:radical SAM protein with 4Fe4S-binding SPASM domain